LLTDFLTTEMQNFDAIQGSAFFAGMPTFCYISQIKRGQILANPRDSLYDKKRKQQSAHRRNLQ
jgi:hypothetical protein